MRALRSATLLLLDLKIIKFSTKPSSTYAFRGDGELGFREHREVLLQVSLQRHDRLKEEANPLCSVQTQQEVPNGAVLDKVEELRVLIRLRRLGL